jgi:hypothetical protein
MGTARGEPYVSSGRWPVRSRLKNDIGPVPAAGRGQSSSWATPSRSSFSVGTWGGPPDNRTFIRFTTALRGPGQVVRVVVLAKVARNRPQHVWSLPH